MPDAKNCPQCGAPLSAGALEGLCPACLLQQGVAADTGTQSQAAPFEPPAVVEVARLFPQLEILAFVGKGGMGAVYKARQPALDRIVALKILPPQTGSGPGFTERFNREARALARLGHPNIVAIYEFGQVNDLPYFIMEFVDGLNLRQLEHAGRLLPNEALKIIPQICEALQFAHDEGIVHRDIKPENILIDKKGRVKIADFGIAKIMGQEPDVAMTETRHAMGTPHYMAPEQVEKPQTVDHRADIFSLGVVFYEMLTGELPLGKFAPPSRKVQVDVRLDEVVLRALEKEPEHRYQHVSQVKTDLETIASGPAAGTGKAGPGTGWKGSSPTGTAKGRETFGIPRRVRLGVLAGALAIVLAFLMLDGRIFHSKPNVWADGIVSDAVTGKPITDARVADISLNRPVQTAWTDKSGHYRIMVWNEADNLNISAQGYQAQDITCRTQPFLVPRAPPIPAEDKPGLNYHEAESLLNSVQKLQSEILGDVSRRDRAAEGRLYELWRGITQYNEAVSDTDLELPFRFLEATEKALVAVKENRWGGAQDSMDMMSEPPLAEVEQEHLVRLHRLVNSPPVLVEAWSPTLGPDEKPDPEKIRYEAKDMAAKGKYEEALQRLIWYFNHALEFNSSLSGVRTSSGLSDWDELGRRYPKAKQALLELRDHKTRELTNGRGYTDMFTDVWAINRELQEDDATFALYKVLRKADPKLARQAYFWVEALLVAKGEYQMCLDGMGGDWQGRFNITRQGFEGQRESQKRMAEMKLKMAQQTTNSGGVPTTAPRPVRFPGGQMDFDAQMKKLSEETFVGQTRQLIEILVGTGRKDDAEKIRDEALTVFDDPRLKTAVGDAQEKVLSHQTGQQSVDTLPPVVVKTVPASGAYDVEPGIVEISATFSKEMADGSWSWSTAWSNSTPETVGDPSFDPSHRICEMKVKLEPGKTYAWWLNSEKFQNFKDKEGNAAVPYLLIFQTSGKEGSH